LCQWLVTIVKCVIPMASSVLRCHRAWSIVGKVSNTIAS
jgi:hypothetical protein